MESESDEAPGIYEETNQDLVRLVDSYGGRAGPEPCDRRRVVRFGGGLNGEWYRALAGAIGLERLEELYDADDVSYNTEQCHARHKKRHRESADETQLRDELHGLKSDYERAAETLKFSEVSQFPQPLIKVFVQLRETRLNLSSVNGEKHANVSHRLDTFKTMPGRVGASVDEIRDASKQFHENQHALEMAAFVPLTLFTLYWDNRWTESNGVEHLFVATTNALHSTQDQIYALRSIILPRQQARQPSTINLSTAERRPGTGTESVDARAMMACYADDRDTLLRAMLEHGCQLAYGTHMEGKYTGLMMAYLFGGGRDDPLRHINIFASSDEDPDAHPPQVWRVVRTFLPGSATQYEGNEATVRDALIAHFLWCYMTRASFARLALDWARYGRVPSAETLRIGDLDAALDATRQALGEYHSMVMLMLLDSVHSPFLLGPFFQRPLRMMVFDFSAPHELDTLNELFGTNTSVLDLVKSAELREKLTATITPNDVAYYRSVGNPVLLLSRLLEGYMQMIRDVVAPRLSVKVRDAEDALKRVPRVGDDDDEGDETEETTPTLRLRPDIEAAVQMAYNKVQRFCKGLKGLPRAQLESPHAAESGLQTDFLTFVRALSDERGLLRTKGKRSPTRYQMRGVMMTTTEALYTLKRYNFRKIGVQRYRITHR